ncbi:MAG TPA: hypothetical protein VGJ86_05940 [Acidimicrobiales bacterium]
MPERRLRRRPRRMGQSQTQSEEDRGGPDPIPEVVPIGHSRHCGASGWRLRLGCTDSSGSTVCPQCEQLVGTLPDVVVGGPVRVIQDHVVVVA